jgi:hypothetical protein
MPRSLFKDTLHGALGFAFVSLVAFSIWAFLPSFFRSLGGEIGLYAAIAVVFLGLSGLVLGPLAGGVGRFYRAFLPAFFAYSVFWCLAWFWLKGREGEWWGAALGCLAFTLIGMKLLGSVKHWLLAAGVLFILHSAGYFAGDWAMYQYCKPKALTFVKNSAEWQQWMILGKLAWGLLYGLGFGAGIGWVFHQARIEA